MDKDRRRRDVIRMKAGKVRKKVLALLLAGTAILGLTGGGTMQVEAAGQENALSLIHI